MQVDAVTGCGHGCREDLQRAQVGHGLAHEVYTNKSTRQTKEYADINMQVYTWVNVAVCAKIYTHTEVTGVTYTVTETLTTLYVTRSSMV